MIEKKLQTAADSLPENFSGFSAVENRIAEKAKRTRSLRRRRLAIAMVLAVLLVGCVAVTEPDYHLYNGNWWQFIPGLFSDPADDLALHDDLTMKAAKKLGITLPDTLGGYPIIDYGRWNLTNQETKIQFAWLSPRYVIHSSYYGVEKEEPSILPDGTESTFHWQEGASVQYGSTEDEIWRRQFGFDENNVYVATDYILANHPVVEITSLEYEGFTIYVAQTGIIFRELPKRVVTWVDYNNGVVFSIDGYFEAPDTLIGYAQEIIDLNR